ncbi:MAG: tetratricopeptide repeat protein [candidate division Zixibacteria bacterium]|nr:tetratricopeptide repeat protein [Candidatus Tariuqbacter arcticus]
MARIAVILLLLISALDAMAEDVLEKEFIRANNLYRDGNFPEAITLYSEIIQAGYDSGKLHYNLGNAYYKNGELGSAILHFEKAKKFLPRDDDLADNLKMAQMRVADRIDTPRLAVWKFFEGVRDYFTLRSLAIITLILYLITLGLAAGYYFQSKGVLKRSAFYLIVPVLICFLLFAVVFGVRLWREANVREAIIVADKVEIVSAPDQGAQGLFSLHEGVKVRILQELPPWAEIALPDGKRGWVKIETFADI